MTRSCNILAIALTALLLMALLLATQRNTPTALASNQHQASTSEQVTFTKDIAPIVYGKCLSCHRTGEVAPFPLATYDDVQRHAPTIVAVVENRYMPPWKAVPGFGHFTGERRLTDSQIDTIQRWVSEGTPEGDPHDLPPTPTYPSGWPLGAPDLIVQPSRSYPVAADGRDIYRCFVIPTNFSEDRWLSGIDVHPGNRKVVHHVIVYLDTSGTARRREAADLGPGPGYTSFGGPGFPPAGILGGWVPGYTAARVPTGVGIALPKGADIVLQVHYHKDGKPESDLTQVGLYFAQGPVDKRVRVLTLMDPYIDIPPADPNYKAMAGVTIPADITVLNITPHMHLLGKQMTVMATLPTGQVEPMVKVTDWDFNWQNRYVYQNPLHLPAGTKIRLDAAYDNTAGNARNPNTPPREVTWGEQTTDEMCIAFMDYTVDTEHLTQGATADTGPEFRDAERQGSIDSLLAHFDINGDGKLDTTELANLIASIQRKRGHAVTASAPQPPAPDQMAQEVIALFDSDGDGKLNPQELGHAAAAFLHR